ncbi:MAG: hypothetical protein NTW19_23755 [Planctomycetota bacterium]|nr:hypothetical protein [Planctomycetota bacterium]
MAKGKRRDKQKQKKQYAQRLTERKAAQAELESNRKQWDEPEVVRVSGADVVLDHSYDIADTRDAELDALSPEDLEAFLEASKIVSNAYFAKGRAKGRQGAGAQDEPLFQEKMETLLRMYEKYPKVVALHIELRLGYYVLLDEARIEAMSAASLQRYPHDVMMLTTRVEEFLDDGQIDQAREAIRGRFTLAEFDPARELFHIDDAIAFLIAIGRFHVETNQIEKALVCLAELEMIDDEGGTADELHDLIYADEPEPGPE